MNSDVQAGLSLALTSDPVWVALLLGLGVLAIVVGIADVVRRRAPTSGQRVPSALLVALRVLSGVMLVLVALQPQWTRQSVTTVQGQVAVLIDRSRSMTVDAQGASRQEQAQALVARWSRESVPARWYGFGTQLREISPSDAADPTTLQEGTSIGAAVEQVARSFGAELGAVVVISDGHETGAAIEATELAALATVGVKVHTVTVGATADRNDDAIVSAEGPSVAFVHQTATIAVKVRAPSRVGQVVPVTLRRDDDVIADGLATIGPDGTGDTEIQVTPERVGRALYRVQIATSAQDPVPANNERALLVRVGRDRTRVLLVSGRPGWDARFLRGLLNADPAVDLITFFILRTQNDLPMASPAEMSLIPFPTDELFREHLDSFDVVLFQDFEYGPYEMARYLPGIAEYVKHGGSFAMVGGSQSFGAGGYARTAIAEILPVTVVDGFDVVEGVFRPLVGNDAREHPIVRLAPDLGANRDLWSKAAPMLGMHRVNSVRDDAQVLLQHPTARSGDGRAAPVLVVGTASEGRVLALTVDSSWRWGMASAATSGDASLYERFWGRALRWLTRDPLLEPSQLDTDQTSYAPGAPITITGLLRDKTYAPLVAVGASVIVRDKFERVVGGADGTTDQNGRITLSLDAPLPVGGYSMTLRDGEERAQAEQIVVVERGGPELSDVTAHPETLAQLSALTGGTHVASIDKAPALADFDRARSRIAGVVVEAPFKQAWFIVLTVIVLALEWFTRRRAGLR